jgi:hypothetical protein
MKRKQSKEMNIGAVASDLYALAGLADGFTVNKGPNAGSMFSAIDAIVVRAVGNLGNLQGATNKQAAAHFAKSAAALETLAVFLDSLMGTTEEESMNPSMKFRRMIAAVIRSFTGEAGRYMERGEMAQGASMGHVGYLSDGYMIAGGEDMALIRSPMEGGLLHFFRQSPDKAKEQIYGFAKAVKERNDK